jgi:hypothetical protein
MDEVNVLVDAQQHKQRENRADKVAAGVEPPAVRASPLKSIRRRRRAVADEEGIAPPAAKSP